MEQSEKEDYVKYWTAHIKETYSLCWCPDFKMSKEIQSHLDELIKLVPKVADDKIKATQNKKEVVVE